MLESASGGGAWPGGRVWFGGGLVLAGSAPGGVCLVWRGGVCSRGGLVRGGCLVRGWGVPGRGGEGVGIPACIEAEPPL